MATVPTERSALWRPAGVPGVEASKATYVAQEFAPHAHDAYLLGVIEAGVHSVWTRGVRHLAEQGAIATMRPGEVHHGGAGDGDGWRQRMVYVPEAIMRASLADAADREDVPTPSLDSAFRVDASLARRFVAAHSALADADALTQASALDALVSMVAGRYAGLSGSSDARRSDAAVDRARDFLHAHYSTGVTLETLSTVTGLRRRALIDRFKARHGLPPHRYLVQVRVRAAAALLADGASVAEAAAATGFADQSHMGRHFRAVTGVTPGRYGRSPGALSF
jgi:AraC-like DNA-binding protein